METAILHAFLLQTRAERAELVMQIRVVPFDHRKVRHGFAGYWFALARIPVLHLWLGQVIRSIVQQGGGHDIAERSREMGCAECADFLGKGLEDIPVGLRFPARRYGRAQRVNVGMQVGGVQVVFSYQVAEGSTTSEYRAEVSIRKFKSTTRSIFPVRVGSRQTTSSTDPLATSSAMALS